MKNIYLFLIILPGFLQAQLTSGITLNPGRGIISKAMYDSIVMRGSVLGSIGLYQPLGSYGRSGNVKTTLDTTLVFKGSDTCQHSFVIGDLRSQWGQNMSCMVMHGPEGCPDKWLHIDVICTVCLKNYTVQEHRSFEESKTPEQIEAERNQSEYEKAKGKLQSLTTNQNSNR